MDNQKLRKIRLSVAVEVFTSLLGQPVPRTTVARWARRGCRGVRLRAEFHGGVLMTTHAACEEFIAQLNAPTVQGAAK